MPAVLAHWVVYLRHVRSIANIVTLIVAPTRSHYFISDDLFPLSASHRSMSVFLLTSNASRTRSLGRLSSTCAKHSKYCNAYSRPLEGIILYQMIYSRSLPAIEACRYFY